MGNIQTFISLTIVVIAIIVIVVIIAVRKSFIEKSQFGTFATESISPCSTPNGLCTETGTRTRSRRCIPNPVTGFGCLREDGTQTFLPEITQETCNPLCKRSVWAENIESCIIYDDENHTITSTIQDCKRDDQFSYAISKKTCVANDPQGDNACIRQDGSLASIGGQEITFIPCSKPACRIGKWTNCSIPGSIRFAPCSPFTSDCGKVVPQDGSAKCIDEETGEVIGAQFCDPTLEPDCTGINTGCLVYPCTNFPAGYITAFQNKRLKFDLVLGVNTTLSADYTPTQLGLATNLQQITDPVNVTVTSDPNLFLYFFFLPTHVFPAGQMYFIAILPLSNQLMRVEENAGGFVLKPLPTSVGPNGLDDDPTMHRWTLTTASAGAAYKITKVAPLPSVDLCSPLVDCIIITPSDHTIF